MKKRFIYCLAMAAVFGQAFTSCKSDPDQPGENLTEKTYTEGALKLTYNGEELVGKSVTFTPDGNGKANITLEGAKLNLSEIVGMIGGGATREDSAVPALEVATAGVLPGSPTVTIPVTLEGEDASSCKFSGTGETDYCTYSYSGIANGENLEFNLSDVKLKNVSLAGTWTLPAFNENFYNLARVVWDSEKGIEMMPGWELPARQIIQLTLAIPMFEPNEKGEPTKSVLNMYEASLKDVTFGEDGTVSATYVDHTTGNEVKSGAGFAQYVITGDGMMRLFLNPAAIIANTVKAAAKTTRALDLTVLVEGLMQNLLPMLNGGIPVHYGDAIIDDDGNTSSDITAFYLGTDTLLPILKTVAPIFQDEEFVKSLTDAAAADPAMGNMAAMLPGILKALPEVINTTSKIEIGINLKK